VGQQDLPGALVDADGAVVELNEGHVGVRNPLTANIGIKLNSTEQKQSMVYREQKCPQI
jgi:hypothetical protein